MQNLYIEDHSIKSFKLDVKPLSIENKIKVKIDFKEFLSLKECEKFVDSIKFNEIKLIKNINNCVIEILTLGPNASIVYKSKM